jgi:hypothetical protein
MADVPPEMMQGTRPVDPAFDDQEELYRRFSSEKLDGGEIAIAAVALPDMSVMRQKYGWPRWLLLDDEYSDWGVLAFHVRDIPPAQELWHEGIISYTLAPEHVPYQRNYPHTEVRVFRAGVHICKESMNLDLLDPDFHLRWRERIVLASHIAVHPLNQD